MRPLSHSGSQTVVGSVATWHGNKSRPLAQLANGVSLIVPILGRTVRNTLGLLNKCEYFLDTTHYSLKQEQEYNYLDSEFLESRRFPVAKDEARPLLVVIGED